MATAHEKATTITVPQHVRERLRDYQIGGRSASEAIEHLMDEIPPDYFRRDLHRALLEEPRLGLKEFRKKFDLPGR